MDSSSIKRRRVCDNFNNKASHVQNSSFCVLLFKNSNMNDPFFGYKFMQEIYPYENYYYNSEVVSQVICVHKSFLSKWQ